MAKSGTIDGTRSGYRPYLRINWNIDQTDIPGNRTRLRLQLYLMHPYNVQYSATKSGKLQGVSFSSTKNVRGTGNTLLQTRYIWVRHNSDGTKTQNLNASFNIAITFSGSQLNSLSVSGKAVLERIPRKTDLTSASITSLQASSSATLSIGRDVKYSGFYHLVTILDGSTWIWDTGYKSGSPSTSYTVKSSTVDKMLGRMRSVTKKTFRVRIRTYTGSGGSGYIGESIRNVAVSVHSSVAPNILETSVEQVGNQWAIDKGMYVQGESGVRAEFRSSASGGAGVRSRNIKISNTSGGSVVGSVFRHQINTLKNTGDITITYTITDTRGRSASSSKTINIHPYSPPRITSFTATRKENTPTTVIIHREGSHTSLSGANSARMLIERKSRTGAWTTVQDTSSASDNWNNSATSTGNSVTSSYDFRATLTDTLGNTATAIVTVSTQRVVLDIHKDEGVGIGKIHEFGVLDVDGPASFGHTGFDVSGKVPVIMRMKTSGNRTGLIQSTDSNNRTVWQIGNRMNNARALYLEAYDSNGIRMNAPSVRINDDIIADSGSNKNGNWVQFYDGTQICWLREDYAPSSMATRKDTKQGLTVYGARHDWTFPKAFSQLPSLSVGGDEQDYGRLEAVTSWGTSKSSTTVGWESLVAKGSTSFRANYIAIGRWK